MRHLGLGLCHQRIHIDLVQLAGDILELAPELAALFAGLDDLLGAEDAHQAVFSVHRPDVGEAALALVLVHLKEFVQRHHLGRSRRPRLWLPASPYLLHPWSRASRGISTSLCVIPCLRRCLFEVLAEAALGHGKVGEGHRHIQGAFASLLVDVGQLVHRPVILQRRVAFQVEALAEGFARIRVELHQGIGAGFDRQLGLFFGGIVAHAVFRLAHRVDVEQCRAAGVEAVDVTFQQMGDIGDGALQHIGGAVRHADEAHLLSDLLLALHRLAVGRHVGHLANVAGGAGLAAGVGVDLGVEHQHLDRHAGGQRAGEVLETDVIHRAVTADGNHRWAQQPLLVAEVLP